MKFIVALMLLAGLGIVAVIGGGAVVTHQLRSQWEGTRQARAAELATIVPRYRADQEDLKDHWLFATVDGPDASSVLTARVSVWPGPDLPGTPLGVPADVVEALRTRGADWASSAAPLDLDELELGWLAELPRFGVWDIEAEGSPMNVRPVDWWPNLTGAPSEPDNPVPGFVGLFPVQKARLLQGLARGDLPAAFAETRALARLCASTELYIGALVAAAMVRVEGQFIEALQARGIDAGVPEPTTSALAEQLHRATWAAPAAFQLLPSVEGLEDDVVVARCAGLAEGLAVAAFLRVLLSDQEAASYARLDGLLTSSRCRLKNLRAAWRDRTAEPSPWTLTEVCRNMVSDDHRGVCHASRLWRRLPFARSAVGEFMQSNMAPEWFRFYAASTTSVPPPPPSTP
jgi:hypothetical protein